MQVIPAALEAMAHLHHRIDKQPKHPFVVMSNGGGVTEAERAQQLSEQLQVPVAAEQVILGHTPMQVRCAPPRTPELDKANSMARAPACCGLAHEHVLSDVFES